MQAEASAFYEVALRLLSRRAHSRLEMVRKLRQRGATSEQVREIILQLQARGYLNDQTFAEQRALEGRRRRNWSHSRIRRDLKARGVSDRMIVCALNRAESERPEAHSLEQAVRRWQARHGPPDTASRLKRLYDGCLRLGFPPPLVRRELDVWFEKVDWREK